MQKPIKIDIQSKQRNRFLVYSHRRLKASTGKKLRSSQISQLFCIFYRSENDHLSVVVSGKLKYNFNTRMAAWPRRRGKTFKRPRYDYHRYPSVEALDSQLLASVLVGSSTVRMHSLVSRGARIDCSNSCGYTPLLLALSRDDSDQSVEVVSTLCELGANVNHTSDVFYGDTPLHFACLSKNTEFTRILLAHHANVHARNHAGHTPLHVAASRGNSEIVKLLCLYGADVNATELYCGYTPLHLAANHSHGDVLCILGQCGADVLQSDSQGLTPIDRCQSTRCKDLLSEYSTQPKGLEELCIRIIRRETGKSCVGLQGYDDLPLPKIIKGRIKLDLL